MKEQHSAVRSAHLFSVGSFGESVGNYLKLFLSNLIVTAVSDNTIPVPQIWPDVGVNIIAAWRPVPGLCELLDQLSHEWQRPFIPLILNSTALRIGPIVVPGRGSCWNCWDRRCQQHAPHPLEQSSLLQHYESHSHSGPQGYLEAFAMMGAARIAHVIEVLDSSPSIPGSIWQIDMITRKVSTSTVVGIHDCPRCGLHRPAAIRSFVEIQHALVYLWPNTT